MARYGFFRNNTCHYITKGNLERFNRDPKTDTFISDFQKILETALHYHYKRKYSSNLIKRKFSRRYWAGSVQTCAYKQQ
jgi:hypothetical protein